ncbi:helix-hairpin-helix domain-containing protein [bacterium]|nr:helix-hairpin-helix domain-containing protein [bacterium]
MVININTCSAKELEQLPGIGRVLAARIVEARPFGGLDDLSNVKGINKWVIWKFESENLVVFDLPESELAERVEKLVEQMVEQATPEVEEELEPAPKLTAEERVSTVVEEMVAAGDMEEVLLMEGAVTKAKEILAEEARLQEEAVREKAEAEELERIRSDEMRSLRLIQQRLAAQERQCGVVDSAVGKLGDIHGSVHEAYELYRSGSARVAGANVDYVLDPVPWLHAKEAYFQVPVLKSIIHGLEADIAGMTQQAPEVPDETDLEDVTEADVSEVPEGKVLLDAAPHRHEWVEVADWEEVISVEDKQKLENNQIPDGAVAISAEDLRVIMTLLDQFREFAVGFNKQSPSIKGTRSQRNAAMGVMNSGYAFLRETLVNSQDVVQAAENALKVFDESQRSTDDLPSWIG